MDIEEIIYKKKLLAIVFRKSIKAKGVRFLTPAFHTLQLGLIEHAGGFNVKDHIHNQSIKYKVDTTEEFLYLEKGKVKLKLFSDNWILIKTVILEKGDFVLLISGGHGLEILEKCRLIEVKQGPYPGDKKAKIFPNNSVKVKELR